MSIMTNPLKPTQASTDLLLAVCGTISRCNSNVLLSKCRDAVVTLGSGAQRLGLQPTAYPNFSSIINSEQAGGLVANQISTNACYSAINSLSCSDSVVQ